MEKGLLPDNQDEPQPPPLPAPIGQLVVLGVRDDLLRGVGAQELDLGAKQLLEGAEDHRLNHAQLVVQRDAREFAGRAAGDGPVLDGNMAGEPAGAHADKVLHRRGGEIGVIELPLQGRKGLPPHSVVEPLVMGVAGIPDFPHIGLLLCKVLEGIGLEILDPLYAGKLVLVPLYVEVHDLLDNGEQPAVGLVHDVHTNAESVLPLDLLHINAFFMCPPARTRTDLERAFP